MLQQVARMTTFPILGEWQAQAPRVRVALSEGAQIAAIIVEPDGRVLLSELHWLHRMAPYIFMHMLPIEEGWMFTPRGKERAR